MKEWAPATALRWLFDPERAARALAELGSLAPDVPGIHPLRALIGSAAGNSPYLSRLMLKDEDYLSHLLTVGPEPALAARPKRRTRS